jgi:hypothetical protein
MIASQLQQNRLLVILRGHAEDCQLVGGSLFLHVLAGESPFHSDSLDSFDSLDSSTEWKRKIHRAPVGQTLEVISIPIEMAPGCREKKSQAKRQCEV